MINIFRQQKKENIHKKIAFLQPYDVAGGIEVSCLKLIQNISKKIDVDIEIVALSIQSTDSACLILPDNTRLIDLKTGKLEHRFKWLLGLVGKLATYFRESKPDVVVSCLPAANAFTVLAKLLAGVPVILILAEHTLSLDRLIQIEKKSIGDTYLKTALIKLTPFLIKTLYPLADCTVAVSSGIAEDLRINKGIPPEKIKIIYNPVCEDELLLKSRLPVMHPWFEDDTVPIILAIGRLEVQKDYPTLIHAFKHLLEKQKVRLLILGEGGLRSQLEALSVRLNLTDSICFHGFQDNPYAYMSKASLLVMSSIWEILPTVIIEALACGCPVVSTNCDYGPSEILEDGKYGWLTPVGDSLALSMAIKSALSSDINKDCLRRRASDFSAESSVNKYMELMKLL